MTRRIAALVFILFLGFTGSSFSGEGMFFTDSFFSEEEPIKLTLSEEPLRGLLPVSSFLQEEPRFGIIISKDTIDFLFGGKKDFDVTVSGEIVDGYIMSLGTPVTDKWSYQGTISLVHSSGLEVELWCNIEIGEGFRDAKGTELDYLVAYNIEEVFGIKVKIGIYYYEVPRIFYGTDGDVVEFFIYFAKDIFDNERHNLVVYQYIERLKLIGWDTPGYRDGTMMRMGMNHEWKFNDWLSVSHSPGLIYDGGLFGREPDFIFKYQAGPLFKIDSFRKGSLSIYPNIKFFKHRHSNNDRRGFERVFGLNVTWKGTF